MALQLTSVFTLHDPARQPDLYAQLQRNAADVLEHTPGFLGSTLSRSDDGTAVVHHATWTDRAAVQAMLLTAGAQASMAASKQLADVRVISASDVSHYRSTFAGPLVVSEAVASVAS